MYLASNWSHSLRLSAMRYSGGWFTTPQNRAQKSGKMFLQNLISTTNRPVEVKKQRRDVSTE